MAMHYGQVDAAEVLKAMRDIRELNVNLTQWQPLIGTVEFANVAGAVAVQDRTMFLDRLTESTASGLAQTLADGNFFGGKVPTGQIILLEGLGLAVVGGVALAADVLDLISSISVTTNLRQRPVRMGSVMDWPDTHGSSGLSANGREIVGQVRFDEPSLLEPVDDFTVTFRVERALTIGAADVPRIRAYWPATRIYSERVLGVA